MKPITVVLLALTLGGCAASAHNDEPMQTGYEGSATPSRSGESMNTDSSRGTSATDSEMADAPEISRSGGKLGEVLIFWPRIIPASDDPAMHAIAVDLQQRMREMVARNLPDRKIDVRPEPERVCPQSGCEAMTVGVLLLHDEQGCAAVALISRANGGNVVMIPWVGDVTLQAGSISPRTHPEDSITVTDFAPCGSVLTRLSEHEADVTTALLRAAE